MAKKAKKSARGRKQDRALVAGGQDYEVPNARRSGARKLSRRPSRKSVAAGSASQRLSNESARNQRTQGQLGHADPAVRSKVDAYVLSIDDAHGGRCPRY